MENYYEIRGYVLGKCWDGGCGSYPTRKYTGHDLSELKTEIEKDFKSGGLDSGMGFERLLSARMFVYETSYIKHEGKIYKHEESLDDFVLGEPKYAEKLDGTIMYSDEM